MSDKELIKQEIERRFNDNMKASEQYTENSKSRALFTSAAKEDYDLLAFIDSLPKEPENKDLENEIERFLDEDENIPSYSKTARHFAEWGRNHFEDKSEMVNEDLEEAAYKYCEKVNHRQTDIITDAFKAGAEWQRKKDKETSVKMSELYYCRIGINFLEVD